jgi:hypothetical protein
MRKKRFNIRQELSKIPDLSESNVDKVANLFNEYESDNLKQIDKLKKVRHLEYRRISGGLKQAINAHGPIDKNLIGSATKRIHGAMLDNSNTKSKIHTPSLLLGILGANVMFIIIKLIIYSYERFNKKVI